MIMSSYHHVPHLRGATNSVDDTSSLAFRHSHSVCKSCLPGSICHQLNHYHHRPHHHHISHHHDHLSDGYDPSVQTSSSGWYMSTCLLATPPSVYSLVRVPDIMVPMRMFVLFWGEDCNLPLKVTK